MNDLAAVLFDRDGTLVVDVPYNPDPTRVKLVDGALGAVTALRARKLKVGVVTNQSGVARQMIRAAQLEEVNARIDDAFGGFDVWCVCPHGPADGCECRKPAPGLVIAASAQLGIVPDRIMVVGDRLADIGAARAAGAVSVLIPSERTEPDAGRLADHQLADVGHLVELVDKLDRVRS